MPPGRNELLPYSVFTFQPLVLLLIVVLPACAVCITCQDPTTNCEGKMVDVVDTLLSFELNAAGVISSTEGVANCKIALNSAGKALPTSPTTCTIFALRKPGSMDVSSPLSAYLLRAAEPMSSMLKCGATSRIINALSN